MLSAYEKKNGTIKIEVSNFEMIEKNINTFYKDIHVQMF